ncbi:hypothetical protein KVV02_000275 [Mortierella alpina]|uniref:tRNA-splicing endonuclease subunit Sen54 N-terminal domain-containing protein n=1 Tax=Mortierella alpina TaxID=64518 RepID=A0A9P8IFH2_MORAP|nr:hypothetical protein KVV02_000275 [Mortierella alpina]
MQRPPHMDAADQDDNDQQPDFRLLLTNARGQSSSQALPSKEAKSSQQPATVLEEQLDAYFQILTEERRGAERTFSRAVFESDLGLFRLTVNKGTHFVSMGHTLRGQIYLFPEEALYLVDRGSLLAEHHGLDMTVQEMWSVYFTCAHVSYRDQDPRCVHEQDSTLAMDRYLVYSYLKRLGFVVIRPGTYTQEPDARARRQASTAQSSALLRLSYGASFVSVLSSWILRAWRNATGMIVSRIGMFIEPFNRIWTRTIRGPLVAHGDRLSYDQILQRLLIIPGIRLAHQAQGDTNIQQGGDHQTHGRTKLDVDFEVYKPGGAFKKRQPGVPDYRVVVTRSSAPLPSLGDLRGYMDSQLDPSSESPDLNVAPHAASVKGKKPKAPDWPKILFAVVDGGQVSFMSMLNIKAVP